MFENVLFCLFAHIHFPSPVPLRSIRLPYLPNLGPLKKIHPVPCVLHMYSWMCGLLLEHDSFTRDTHLLLFLSAAISSQQLSVTRWALCLSFSQYWILCELSLCRDCACCHNHCEFIYLLCLQNTVFFFVVIYHFWLLLRIFSTLLNSDFWAWLKKKMWYRCLT